MNGLAPKEPGDPGAEWNDDALYAALLKADRSQSIAPTVAGLARELNELLTRVCAAIALARVENPQVALAEAEDACLAAREPIRRLLSLSSDQGEQSKRRRIHPRELLQEAARAAGSATAAQVAVTVSETVDPISGDAAELPQAFQNLVRNAAEAMSPPPPRPTIQLGAANTVLAEGQVAGLPAGDYVEFEVRDNGAGIAPANLEKIWDPLFSTRKHGAGLGLPATLAIVRRHGGQIGVDSAVGVGSVFTVFLPRARVAEAAGGRRPKASRFRTGRILVMDDDETIRQLTAKLLEKLDYTCDVAPDGEDAVKQYRRYLDIGRPYDAVLLDLFVPGKMGGEEAFTQLRELDPDVRAIACDPGEAGELEKRSMERGFSGWLAKPFRLSELGEAIKTVLG